MACNEEQTSIDTYFYKKYSLCMALIDCWNSEPAFKIEYSDIISSCVAFSLYLMNPALTWAWWPGCRAAVLHLSDLVAAWHTPSENGWRRALSRCLPQSHPERDKPAMTVRSRNQTVGGHGGIKTSKGKKHFKQFILDQFVVSCTGNIFYDVSLSQTISGKWNWRFWFLFSKI